MTTKLISELRRLYLLNDRRYDDATLARHLRGESTFAAQLAGDGYTRAIVLDFHKAEGERHWLRLCEVANALQADLGLPAPAVSVSGGDCYRLWLSLEAPLTTAQAAQFTALLHKAYFEDEPVDPGRTSVELPPCLHAATGLWAAFINPGMGGALAEDLGLEMPPNENAQAAFLEKLGSISGEVFEQALAALQRKHADALSASASMTASPAPASGNAPAGSIDDRKADGGGSSSASGAASAAGSLLLKDATLEDIVRHLHARGIEPTFRHVLKN
ncbi:hypothetical protein [Duganella callida]|uniref:Uncharacterized protein n=1 Tax=Duganella callida TaxID=2561932 RepID=A0A4Y9SEA2_9BURK|nr:hypothetical protein [Duganella callida]TFW21319.1 hypothetical protein E4L98_13535 [Duganella callida]